MISVELVIYVPERYLGVFGTYLYLNCIFFGQEVELLERSLEMLDLTKDES